MSYNASGLVQNGGSVVYYGNTGSSTSGSSGITPLVVVTAERYASQTITLTNQEDGTVLTQTANSSGVAKFNVSSAGTWVATANDGGTTVTLGNSVIDVNNITYETDNVKFAFHYSESDSSPDSVTYPIGYDNSNWSSSPAYMDFTNDTWVWGAWDPNGTNSDKVSWLFPKPCMLKYDGTTDYYLDADDFTKKADGVTTSDVANTSYTGNAMIEWGQNDKKIWWKIIPDVGGNGFTFCVANYQADEDYDCWNHYDCNNTVKNHFYTPIYFGSLIDNKIRSLSGQTNSVSENRETEINYAKANNTGLDVHWYTEVYADWLLTSMLTALITKSLASQEKVGSGRSDSGNRSAIATGTMNDKGMFWGSNNGTDGVKVWGMENVWGNCWRAIGGMMSINNTVKTKLTYGTHDGSTANAYNLDGTGYLTQGSLSGVSGGYISHMTIDAKGISAATVSGSSSTYYTDGCTFSSGDMYAVVGGDWEKSTECGMFCTDLEEPTTLTWNRVGVALSYK